MHTCLQKYLFAYRNSPHCTTGKKPSEVIFKGCVKTRFDHLRSDTKTAERKQIESYSGKRLRKQLGIGDKVYYRIYNNRNVQWDQGSVDDVLGNS